MAISGAAQGLNTGIHDAVNLAWKLALQIRGITRDSVLKTYSTERKTAVQQLIDYDRDIAMLMSRKWPSWYKGDPDADPNLALGELFDKAAPFNTGLGIAYPRNVLNQESRVQLTVVPGSRPPDVELSTPGTNHKVRLQRITRNFARFWVLVLTGDVNLTRSSLQELENFLGSETILKTNKIIGWITVSTVIGCSPYEAIGMRPFGDAYYDSTSSAHDRFGVNMKKGSVVILRPDGLVGSAGPVDGPWIRSYFSKVLTLQTSDSTLSACA
ncbi:hypothetical protein SLS62_011047 [Diatrype stigma]|uniref:FAD-binding domain-containing protein n=1 Tax=Diatrype stigma TaxID=117547 RepID=A0AAN9YGI4_9PEZI